MRRGRRPVGQRPVVVHLAGWMRLAERRGFWHYAPMFRRKKRVKTRTEQLLESGYAQDREGRWFWTIMTLALILALGLYFS